jgi:hypothetical protein
MNAAAKYAEALVAFGLSAGTGYLLPDIIQILYRVMQ